VGVRHLKRAGRIELDVARQARANLNGGERQHVLAHTFTQRQAALQNLDATWYRRRRSCSLQDIFLLFMRNGRVLLPSAAHGAHWTRSSINV